MSCDVFCSSKARELLQGKSINFYGDSNSRALYKDLIWLLEDGKVIPEQKLKCKNEPSHANDIRVSDGKLHGGRNYEEVRLYSHNPYVTFQFITRLHLPAFINAIKCLRSKPDVVVLNSCVWDLTRWGSNGVEQYKNNLNETFIFLKTQLPTTRIIWMTTLPPSFKSEGGFLTKEIEFLRNMLPWHIMYANKYASDLARSLQIDVLDLHYKMGLHSNLHTKDGIHWMPKAVRYGTNLLLTHLALTWCCTLPGIFRLDRVFLEHSAVVCNGNNEPKLELQKTEANKRKNKINNRRFMKSNCKNFFGFSNNRNTFIRYQNPHIVQPISNGWQHFYSNFQNTLINQQNLLNIVPVFNAWHNTNLFINSQNPGRVEKIYCNRAMYVTNSLGYAFIQ